MGIQASGRILREYIFNLPTPGNLYQDPSPLHYPGIQSCAYVEQELLPREYRVLLAMRAVDDFAFAKDFAAARVNADLSPVASKSLVFHDMTSPMSADPADLEYHWFTGAKTEDGKLPEIIPGEQQKRFPTRRFFEKGGAGLPSINQDLAGLQTGQFNQPQRPSPPLNLDVFKAAQAKSQTLPSMPESAL